jgi:release factor glutamine methyltransferase
MQTVAEARKWAMEQLKRARAENPALTADLLLASVLGWDRIRILSHTEHIVPEESDARFQGLVARRIQGEPLQYLTGEKEFFGLTFQVAPGVLIPRPETEILVERAIDLIRSQPLASARFADIGTGSGCIAISVARAVASSSGWAVDFSAPALEIARGNAVRHNVEERVLFVRSDLFECFPPKPCFDLVLCNPPYIALEECDSLPSEVRVYEPHEALFGGASGLEMYRRLVPGAASRIKARGHLLLELGAGQAAAVGTLVESEGFMIETIVDDLQGIPRCLVARKTLPEK